MQRNFARALQPVIEEMAAYDRRDSNDFFRLNNQMGRIRNYMMRNASKIVKARNAAKQRKEEERRLRKEQQYRLSKTLEEGGDENKYDTEWGSSWERPGINSKKDTTSKPNDSNKQSRGNFTGVSSESANHSRSNSSSRTSQGKDNHDVHQVYHRGAVLSKNSRSIS